MENRELDQRTVSPSNAVSLRNAEPRGADQEWLTHVARWCRAFITAFARPYGVKEEDHVARLLRGLNRPPTLTDACVLRFFLARTALTWVRSLHRMYQRDAGVRCRCGIERCALSFIEDRSSDPVVAFACWAKSSLGEFRTEHPLPFAFRIAGLVDRRLAGPITARSLANELGTGERVVRNVIQRRFGQPLHAFVTTARVRCAVELLTTTDTKIEVVGMLVGYRSKKNFYCAIHRYTGRTPNNVRRTGPPGVSGLHLNGTSTPRQLRPSSRTRYQLER